MKQIQNDVFMKWAEWEVPFIINAVENKKVTDPVVLRGYEELKKWDYFADLDTTAPLSLFSLQRN